MLGSLESARDYPDARFVNCIGSTVTYRRRPEILARTGLPLDRFGTVIHPTASVSASAEIGPDTVLFQHVTLAAKCRLGAHVTVLPQSVVSHDCMVEDYSILAGGVSLSGAVHVERCCYLGANSAVRSRLRVGEGSLVGMGSNRGPGRALRADRGGQSRPVRRLRRRICHPGSECYWRSR